MQFDEFVQACEPARHVCKVLLSNEGNDPFLRVAQAFMLVLPPGLSIQQQSEFLHAASSAGALWRMMAADDKQQGAGLGVKKRIDSAEGENALQLLMKVCPSR